MILAWQLRQCFLGSALQTSVILAMVPPSLPAPHPCSLLLVGSSRLLARLDARALAPSWARWYIEDAVLCILCQGGSPRSGSPPSDPHAGLQALCSIALAVGRAGLRVG